MVNNLNREVYIDKYSINDKECLPDTLLVRFEEILNQLDYPKVKITLNGEQAGSVIDDNSFIDDGYRYHDVFHYTFATLLDWSPCSRAMLKRKRKSNVDIDRIEDGARAAITEEAISLMIFEEAKQNNFFEKTKKVSTFVLDTIKLMTSNFEVRAKSKEEWEVAILKSYELFRLLVENKGGQIFFDRVNKTIKYNELFN